MILAELRDRNAKLETPNKKVTAALNYLCDLSSNTGVEIATWDIEKVFGEDFCLSPRELNKKFFQHVKLSERLARSEVPEKLKKELLQASKQLRPEEHRQLISAASLIEKRIIENQRAFENHTFELRNIRERITMLEGKKSDFVEQVKEIVDQGFFELTEVKTNVDARNLVIFQTNEIILTHPQGDADENTPERDFKLNFGRLLFTITKAGMIEALPSQDQANALIRKSGYFFPYITPEGRICWGTASSAASSLQAQSKFSDAFMLLQRLCQTYSDEGPPYISIQDFFVSGKMVDGKAPWIATLSQQMAEKYGISERTWKHTKAIHEGRTSGFLEFEFECYDCNHNILCTAPDLEFIECDECGLDNVMEDVYSDSDINPNLRLRQQGDLFA